MVKPLHQKENEEPEIEVQKINDDNLENVSIKQGSRFNLLDADVTVKQIDLPRITLELVDKKKAFNPQYRGHIIAFGGHDFLVKAATGSRLYLLLVDIDDKLKEDMKHEPV